MEFKNSFGRGLVVSEHRFFLLFLFLLTALIMYPYAREGSFSYYVLRVLGSAIILISVYAVSFRRSFLIFAVILAIPALVRHLQIPQPSPSAFSIINIVLSFVFDVFVVVVIFRRIFADEQANSETVFGALCIYLLVGFSFASVYGMLATWQPNAFYLDPHANLHAFPDCFDFIYYSYCTLTSVGASGITPVTGQARSLTVLESILGILYLAVLIARLMGAYRPKSKS